MWADLYEFYVKQPNVRIFSEQFVISPFNTDKNPKHFPGQLYSFSSEGMKKGHIGTMKPEMVLTLVTGSINATDRLHLFGKVPLSKTDLHGGHSPGWNLGTSLKHKPPVQ